MYISWNENTWETMQKKESERIIIFILPIIKYFSSLVASFIYFFLGQHFFYFGKDHMKHFILQNGVKTELTNIKKEQKKLQDLEKVKSKAPGDQHQIVSFYKPIISWHIISKTMLCQDASTVLCQNQN